MMFPVPASLTYGTQVKTTAPKQYANVTCLEERRCSSHLLDTASARTPAVLNRAKTWKSKVRSLQDDRWEKQL